MEIIPAIRVYFFPDTDRQERDSDRRIYVCAERFLKAEAEEAGQSVPSAVHLPAIRRGEGVKPCFAVETGIHFSVSHSGDFWVCAVSRREIGIDLQKKTTRFNPGIAERFFHADEHRYLETNGFGDFFMVWTAKESYVKFTGQGIGDGFSAFSVVQDGRISPKANGAELWFLPFDSDYCLCLCTDKMGAVRIERVVSEE